MTAVSVELIRLNSLKQNERQKMGLFLLQTDVFKKSLLVVYIFL